ncbi:MAG: GT-D fold domain-containing protein [Planctomycetaceae bacterium]|nr:GT-D fold domain-containing protein [Planctomycetaceae bacterium]
MLLTKIKKELERTKKKVPFFGKIYKQLEKKQYELDNLPYELCDKIKNEGFTVPIPIIKNADETIDKILLDKCSLSRFGDGEFIIIEGGHINYQHRSPVMAEKLKKVIVSDNPNFLVALSPCFGSLDKYLPPVANFWRKHMVKRRAMYYSYLDMKRTYYDLFLSRPYIQSHKTEEHYKKCGEYFKKVQKLWAGRDIIICEGMGTRFGMFNDLLDGAKSISRILCPPRNAFDKYEEILKAFDGIDKQKLVLVALGPTATVLAYDLCNKGFQAIDIGALDIDYEWFLRKETRLGVPVKFKYVDSDGEGRKIESLDDPVYKKQIIRKII